MLRKQALTWLLLVLALALAACGGSDDDEGDLSVELALTPDPPLVGPATVIVTLHDADGQPVSGAEMELEGTMTHAGMVPVFGEADEKEPGHYEAELEFTMGGDWVIIVRADLPDGSSLEKEFDMPGVKMP
ncbi:MAG: FixH family protein [Anaerolineae bacterium]|jgi:hypothetical protein